MVRFLVWTIVGSLAIGSVLRADEVKVELDKLPKAVLQTVKKRFPKAELIEAAKETDGDIVEFEVALTDGGTHYDVMLTPDGKLTLIEKTIEIKSLPEAIVKTIQAKHPQAKIKLAEEMTKVDAAGKESLEYYEVLVDTTDKKSLELEIGTDGTIRKTEDKSREGRDEKKKDK